MKFCLLRNSVGIVGWVVACLSVCSDTRAQSALDNTFNATLDGRVSTIALQADGKILVGGSFTTVNGVSKNNFARLNANGSLDDSFAPANAPAQFVSRIV